MKQTKATMKAEKTESVQKTVSCPLCNTRQPVNNWTNPTCPKCGRGNAILDGKCRDCGFEAPWLKNKVEYHCHACVPRMGLWLVPTRDSVSELLESVGRVQEEAKKLQNIITGWHDRADIFNAEVERLVEFAQWVRNERRTN